MRVDPKAAYAGITKITAGVQSAVAPIVLPPNQLAWGTNLDCRTDFMRPRPGWVQRPLSFVDRPTDCITAAEVQAFFENGIFEGAIVFERFGQIVCMIGGHLFKIDPGLWKVTDITPYTVCHGPPDCNTCTVTYQDNANNRYRAWFCEAEQWVIVQDGNSIPWIYDGATVVRSDTLGLGGRVQVPIGQAMCYAQGRLHVASVTGRSFVIGDIVGGDSGTAPYDFKDSVLCFTENDVINGGGSFSVPINAGLLTAFRPLAQIDTSMGQGPTQVFTTNAIFSLNLPVDRATWQDVNFPIGTVSNVSNGAYSDRCTPNVNGDIWFRAPDGIRAFMVARRDFQAAWINAPLSHEIERTITADDENLLGYSSAALFDNRLLFTTQPYRVWDHGIVHQGLVQLDFEPVTSLSERNPIPTWLGLYTGVRPLQILSGSINGVPRCFIFALDADNKITLWEITKAAISDANTVADSPIQWSFETAAFSFTPAGDSGNASLPGRELWSLDGGRLYVDEIEGRVRFALQWKPDQDPCWHDWHMWSICAQDLTCTEGTECLTGPPNLRMQYRKYFNLPEPRDGCDSVNDKPYHIGREFQVRAVITGRCRIKMLELVAHAQEEDVARLCAASEECVSVACCPPDDFSYLIPRPAPPAPTGACCLAAGGCLNGLTEAECRAEGGEWQGEGTDCSGGRCSHPQPTGACCLNGNCTVVTEEACLFSGGTYLGDNTNCDPNPCPPAPTGACCIDGECLTLTEANCLNAGGTYLGDGVSCDGNPCAPVTPTGACCIRGECSVRTEADCAAMGGTYQGDETTCSPDPCAPPVTGACCIEGICSVLTEAACVDAGGIYQGNGTTCPVPSCQPPTPIWPPPDPYDCVGEAEMAAIEVTDPVTLSTRFVGINPGAGDPNVYLSTFGAPGCLDAWCLEVWNQFIATSTTYSKARLIWKVGTLGGSNYQGQNVFPDQLGSYPLVGSLTHYITVEWCPAPS